MENMNFDSPNHDKDGFPIYTVGYGQLKHGGSCAKYCNTYINLDADCVEQHRPYGDDSVMVIYNKTKTNKSAVQEILRHMRSNSEPIIYQPNNLYAVHCGKYTWNRIVKNGIFILCMGERMYSELFPKIASDENLKRRLEV